MENIMGIQGDRDFMLIQEKESIMLIQGKERIMGIQEKGNSMGVQEKGNPAGIQGEGSSMGARERGDTTGIQEKGKIMGVQEKEDIMGTQERRNIMETQEKGNSMSTQEKGVQEKGDTMGIREKEGSMGIQGEGSSVGPRGESSAAGIPGEESTIAGIPGANGATETRGATPADGGGQTPAGSPAVAALEVMDTLLGALAPRGPLFEKAARRALARIEGIARRDPRALLALRALLASLSRALREQIDLHARVQGLAEALGDPLAESCAAPRDMRALAGIVGSARGRGLAYQSLYDLILACDARCGALLHRWAER